MRINEVLVESQLINAMPDSDGQLLAKFLHQNAGVADNERPQPNTDKRFTVSAALVQVFQGPRGWAALYIDEDRRDGLITVVNQGKIQTHRTWGYDKRNTIEDLIGTIQKSWVLHNIHWDSDSALQHRAATKYGITDWKWRRLQPRKWGVGWDKKLPGTYDLAERLWKMSPQVFSNLRKQFRKQVRAEELRPLFSDTDQMEDLMDEIVRASSNRDEAAESWANEWLRDAMKEENGSDEEATTLGGGEDEIYAVWEECVKIAAKKLKISHPEDITGRAQPTPAVDTRLNALLPEIQTQLYNWFRDMFYARVKKKPSL